MIRIHHAACRRLMCPNRWVSFQPRQRFPQIHSFQPLQAPFTWQTVRFNRSQPVKNPETEIQTKSVQVKSDTRSVSEDPEKIPIESIANLLKDIFTIPNLLTMTRIAATPFIGYFFAINNTTAAVSLFTYLCVTDFIDGFVARRYNLKSVLGSILDPLADKFLMTTCTVALYIGGSMPTYVASIIVGRDVMLSFMAFYMRYKSLPEPKTLLKFLDPKITTHTVLPNMLGKVNTALQMLYIGGLMLLPGLEQILTLPWNTIFSWYGTMVAGTTLASGVSYLLSRGSSKNPL